MTLKIYRTWLKNESHQNDKAGKIRHGFKKPVDKHRSGVYPRVKLHKKLEYY